MGEVVQLDVITKVDLSPENVIKNFDCENIEHVLVVSYTKDGKLNIDMSSALLPLNVWMLELAKKRLLDASDD
jgi:hypothetical protein